MLTKTQLHEIREHLEQAQHPVFLYDNDVDGFCSYVLLRRFIGRGKGVAVKSHPAIDTGYVKRAQELGADVIFVLDRPHLGDAFLTEASELAIPVVWIDHHDMDTPQLPPFVHVYNPTKGSNPSQEPTTYLCVSATGRIEDHWIALMGCIADHYLPDFSSVVGEQYPELWKQGMTKPFEAYYTSGIGRLARAISFGLKDSVTHVVQLQNFLIACSSPSEVYLALESDSPFGKKYREILNKYTSLLSEALLIPSERFLFFNYGGTLSISSDLANELSFRRPKTYICVAYSAGPITNISMRGANIRSIFEVILPLFSGATGGGHPDAVGARISTSELERFKHELSQRIQ
jgi:hypothetical protein